MNDFLQQHGWSSPLALTPDASARRYYRVRKGGQSAILMEGATPEEFQNFIKIGQWLRNGGFNAPDIYEMDPAHGLMLIEDLGDTTFTKAIEQGADQFELYAVGADVLAALTHKDAPLDLPDYYQSNVHKGRRRIIDWFVPAMRGERNPDGLVEAYLDAWDEVEYSLPHTEQGFVHADFHAGNLMWMPERGEITRCGILDFQGAMHGPVLYDLANLLFDARREVSPDIHAAIWATLDEFEQPWTRILATQFHCRVIGQFVKFAVQGGNTGYLPHIPRLQKYMLEGLKDPVLAPLKAFFDDLKLDFSTPFALNTVELTKNIREDAF